MYIPFVYFRSTHTIQTNTGKYLQIHMHTNPSLKCKSKWIQIKHINQYTKYNYTSININIDHTFHSYQYIQYTVWLLSCRYKSIHIDTYKYQEITIHTIFPLHTDTWTCEFLIHTNTNAMYTNAMYTRNNTRQRSRQLRSAGRIGCPL